MNPYRISGIFRMGSKKQPFTKELLAANNDDARERISCILGSKHRTKRRFIKIDKIEELTREEVTDPDVLQRMGD
jgi:large subunit ribosomal protein LX